MCYTGKHFHVYGDYFADSRIPQIANTVQPVQHTDKQNIFVTKIKEGTLERRKQFKI